MRNPVSIKPKFYDQMFFLGQISLRQLCPLAPVKLSSRHQRRQNVDFEVLLRIQIRKWESLVFTPENISLEVKFISLLTRVSEVAAFGQLQNANFENLWRLDFASKLRTLTWVFWSSTSNAPGYKSHLEIESFFVKQKLCFWELS